MKREDCNLRPLDISDAPMVLVWRNSPRIRAAMYTDHLITREEHENWISGILDSKDCKYLVFEMDNRPIGLVGFNKIYRTEMTADWSMYVGEENVVPGAGAAMEFLALETAFEVCSLKMLYCEVLLNNPAVIKMHKRYGFIEESETPDYIVRDNQPVGMVRLKMEQSQWSKVKSKMGKILYR